MQDYRLKSAQFRAEREESWDELESLLLRLDTQGVRGLSGQELARLPVLYRGAASSLSVARAVSLDRNLLDYLENLVGRAYLAVYARPDRARGPVIDFFVRAFPSMFRKYFGFFVLSCALMTSGILAGFFMVMADSEAYYGLVAAELAQGRDPEASTEELREVLFPSEAGSWDSSDSADAQAESGSDGETAPGTDGGSDSSEGPGTSDGSRTSDGSDAPDGSGTSDGSDGAAAAEGASEESSDGSGSGNKQNEDPTKDLNNLNLFASFLFSHNAKIAILCFALGFAAGAPTVYLLFVNGLMLGAMSALYHQRGLSLEFWGWILPHGVTELGAICLCGMAGLAIGHAVVFPGRRTRLENLAIRGREVAVIVIGAVLMLFLAALIEGYFRQLVESTSIRWTVATLILLFWVYYFGFVGRRRRVQD